MPKKSNIFVKLVLLCIIALQSQNSFSASPQVADLAQPKIYTLQDVYVVGAKYIDIQAIKILADLPKGKEITIPGDRTQTAIKNLWRSKLFDDVKIYAAKVEGDNIWLTIEVTEMPRFGGTKVFSPEIRKGEENSILDKLNLVNNIAITQNWANNAEKIIKDYYLEKGFYDCEVSVKTEPDNALGDSENRVKVIFEINKGKRLKIGELNVISPTEFSEKKIKRKLKETKEKRWWRVLKVSKFLEEEYQTDQAGLYQFYNDKGFKNFKITGDSIYRTEDGLIGLDIFVEEDKLFYFGNIKIFGNTEHSSDSLREILKVKTGDVFNQSYLDQRVYMNPAGLDVSSIYMDQGYLNFQAIVTETSIREDSLVDLEILLYEGKQFRVGNVSVVGNDKTNDHVIFREIRTKPGDLFNRTNIIRTQRELSNLGYFAPEGFDVQIEQNDADGTVDLTYVVQERPSDQIQLSGGFGAGRVVGTLGLSFSNFSARNIFKPSSWRPIPTGDGQRLSIQGQSNGAFFQSLSASFTEPWLGGKKPNTLSLSYSRTLVNRSPGVDELINGELNPNFSRMRLRGGSIGFGKRLKRPDDYFSFFANLSYQKFLLQNYVSVFPQFPTGNSNNLALGLTLQRNSVSEPIYPTYGSTVKMSVKATLPYSSFRGDDFIYETAQDRFNWVEYHKWKFTVDWYTPLSPSTSEKKSKLILNNRIGLGMLGGYSQEIGVSPFERFYVGGVNLNNFGLDGREIIFLRGYDEESISGGAGAPIVAKYTTELRYPLSTNPQATIYTLAFLEAGNTWNSFREFNPFELKRSGGIGLRVFLPMFGLLGLDYGWRFDDSDISPFRGNMPNGQLHFSIGMNIGEL